MEISRGENKFTMRRVVIFWLSKGSSQRARRFLAPISIKFTVVWPPANSLFSIGMTFPLSKYFNLGLLSTREQLLSTSSNLSSSLPFKISLKWNFHYFKCQRNPHKHATEIHNPRAFFFWKYMNEFEMIWKHFSYYWNII